jgi:hypothetical protein
MANLDLSVVSGYDVNTSESSFIPVGAIVSYGHNSFITNIDEMGMIPCDGRSLNTYIYRNLHKVIGNIYGGTAYVQGSTDIASAVTTFTVPLLNNSIKFIAMKNSQALNASGGSLNHFHTNATDATATASTETFIHGHYWTATANATGYGYHEHYIGGFYFGSSNQPVNQPVGKVDGNQSAAGRYHSHSGYVPTVGFGQGYLEHDHYADGNMFTPTSTNHTHSTTILNQSGISNPSSAFPGFTTAMFYIKI